ncbi:FkbM family methyltransferase [Lipingzhangella halophila]|uniref:FkbM family methyltransferase n=1 Tax=Lipingzhangella halophila TaxID=1783352 RepID=A0A7W7W5G4_9ACTN|nr:FkbM family methyltransferase [Lipingzhangella halophila]MBB4933839.1 FkbM family methyltransferase [Lipingzhangella halophila]
MPTLRRRILEFLPRLNVHVKDLESGAALVTRRNGYRVTPVGPRSWLVRRGKDGFTDQISRMAETSSAKKWSSVGLGPNAHLFVNGKQDDADEFQMQKAAQDYMGARHVAALLRHYQVNCVFDVGANIGQYGRRLRQHGYTGRIVSFEPVATMTEKLRRAAENDPEWWVYPYALGREERVDTINVVYGSMSSILDPTTFGNERYKRFRNTRSQEIDIRRLDSLMDEALKGIDAPRSYLKLDTQGYDLEAFAGAGVYKSEFVGLQSEVALMRIYEGMPRMAEAIEAYEAEGFEITGMFPVTREETTGRVLEFDCVMVRADAMQS